MEKLNKKESVKGFTLIEILVVIGIIAILAAIVLIAINPARQFAQANDTQRSANVNAILNAVGQYMVDNNGNLPPSIAGMDGSDDPENIGDDARDLCADVVPTYIPALPTDPLSDHEGEGITYIDDTDLCGEYDSEYTVAVDDDGRVTIAATPQGDDSISVTR